MKTTNPQYRQEFIKVLGAVKTTALLPELLNTVLTPQELSDVCFRWQIIKLLNRGLTQRAVAARLKVSIAKVTRGARVLLDSKDNFKKFLAQFK